MILEISALNGNEWFDLLPYIANQGLKWQRSDVDGPSAGRDLSGKLWRNRVATKVRLDVTCRPLTSEETSKVLTAVMPEWVMVRYYDPQVGSVVVKTMYSNNNPASFLLKKTNGNELWGGITFPLIEQ